MADLGSARAAESAALSALKHSESAAARALTEATAQTERKHAEVMSALQSMTIESTAKEARIKELEAQLASMSSQLKAAGEQTAK